MGSHAFAQKPAESSQTRLILKSISARYKKLGNWKARFTQETSSPGLGTGSVSEGQFEFVGPSKFRYSLVRPEQSAFISNGREAWQIIKRKDKATYVRHFRDLRKIDLERYLLILRGFDNPEGKVFAELSKKFEIQAQFKNEEIVVEFRPKNASEVTSLTLYFKNDSEAPAKAVIKDSLDTTTTLVIMSFESIKNPIDKKLFTPEYPKDSEIEEL